MYADDTIVLAESEDEMQKLHEYYEDWKFKQTVNFRMGMRRSRV